MFSILGKEIAEAGFYINLERSTERKNKIENQINVYKIESLERFNALEDNWKQYSCTKSHLAVLENCIQNGYETVFISEDDFDIRDELYYPISDDKKYFEQQLTEVIYDTKNVDWDIILLGCNPKSFLIPVTENLAQVHKSTGAWAYIIKKRAIKYILENLNYQKDLLAIDDYLPYMNHKGFKTLCTTPMLIHHSVGLESTLQPNGPVNYDVWINGSFDKFFYENISSRKKKFEIERNITIVITGNYTENFLFYLNYLLYSLPKDLIKCKFIINYDESSEENHTNRFKLISYLRDKKNEINIELDFITGGSLSSFDNLLKKITTPFFIFLEHDWVFLNENKIDFLTLLEVFKKHNFINAVWFSKDDNISRDSEISEDKNKNVTPFELEKRVEELKLVTTCRWSNNPVMFRTSKMRFWFEEIVKKQTDGFIINGLQSIEETLIYKYRKEISEHEWEEIRDNWGTFLYGNIGDGPFVAYTDGSKKYQGSLESQSEINGKNYIKNNPIEL
jgi:GR25 family glycosyltransferase involved in LPS biosynthesis